MPVGVRGIPPQQQERRNDGAPNVRGALGSASKMIILDTNVISEPLRPRADPAVVRWLDAQHPDTLYLTAVTLSEVLIGIALLPAGKRKRGMELNAQSLQMKLFCGPLSLLRERSSYRFRAFGKSRGCKGLPNFGGRLSDRRDCRGAWVCCGNTRYCAVSCGGSAGHQSVGKLNKRCLQPSLFSELHLCAS